MDPSPTSPVARAPARNYALAMAACALTTLVAAPLMAWLDPANIVMLFLLTVVLVAARLGRGPAITSAFVSVALFDFFFVPPRFSFTVSDAQYLVTFAIMLAVALIIGHLAAGLRSQATAASAAELRSRALFEIARELAGALTAPQAEDIVRRFVREHVGARERLLLRDERGELKPTDGSPAEGVDFDLALAGLSGMPGEYVDLDAPHPVAYFPLNVSGEIRGVLAVSSPDGDTVLLREHHELLATVASLVAIVIARLHYVEVANRSQMQVNAERLRSSMLSALSHDIRTPLTALVGLADSLALARPPLSTPHRLNAEAVRDQALRVNGLVANLLDMARLNTGQVHLRKEWQPLEEVVGSSIKLLGRSLSEHPIRVALPEDLPLLEFDAVLIERVLCNLLENAAKYSPAGAPIEIAARTAGPAVEVSVHDRGAGIADAGEEIFEMFARGAREWSKPGVGLGLAICRAIVDAHGGTIRAANDPGGGARFTFTLPRGEPPSIEDAERVAVHAS